MHRRFDTSHLMLLVGGAVFVATLLVLVVYLLQKTLGRTSSTAEAKRARVPVENDAAFSMATVKGVITQLKTDQKDMQEKLTAAERRADANNHKFELLAREVNYGLMVFEPSGFITFSNPLARQLLGVDTLARRRHSEICQDIPALATRIAECFSTGAETRKETIELPSSDLPSSNGAERRVEATILPTRDRSGALEAVVCLFRAVP